MVDPKLEETSVEEAKEDVKNPSFREDAERSEVEGIGDDESPEIGEQGWDAVADEHEA